MASPRVRRLLDSINLGVLSATFHENKIHIYECDKLNDQELIRLGIETIGDRVRFKDAVRRQQESSQSTSSERATRTELFRPGRLSSRLNNSKMKKTRTWTVSCFCLSDRNSVKIPTSSQKAVLQSAGLGFKRISFPVNGDETCVQETILSNFVQLKDAGGFELLKVMSNCRQLEVVKSKWNVETLKVIFGSQCKMFIRPIQENLSSEPIDVTNATSSVKEQCKHCHAEILITKLREHVKWCALQVPVSDSEDEILPDIIQTVEKDETSEKVEETEEVTSHTVLQMPRQENDVQENPVDADLNEVEHVESPAPVDSDTTQEDEVDYNYENIVHFCTDNNIDNPVEILREMQKRIVIGRSLEVEDESIDIGEGKTNFIMIDRNNLLETAFEEVASLQNLRYTLEVNFYGETAVDNGGPRKEFFRLVLLEIKESFFNPLRENPEEEKYESIGKILALSLQQNGTLPRILDADMLNEVFVEAQPRSNLMALRKGLDALGIVKIIRGLPLLIHLFTPGTSKPLTIKMMSQLLKPIFSENGTNRSIIESRMYRRFLKYMKEAASGRRGNVSLNKILMFSTGAEEEPVLGFKIHPSIHFIDTESVLPTANTCINRLNLPRSSDLQDTVLFKMFDMAFSNTYFGLQ